MPAKGCVRMDPWESRAINREIYLALMRNQQTNWAQLAEQLGMSKAAMQKRVQRVRSGEAPIEDICACDVSGPCCPGHFGTWKEAYERRTA